MTPEKKRRIIKDYIWPGVGAYRKKHGYLPTPGQMWYPMGINILQEKELWDLVQEGIDTWES